VFELLCVCFSVATDLSIACVGSFSLVYLNQIADLSMSESATVLLIGLIAHALAMPICAAVMDYARAHRIAILSSRKFWHFVGVVFALTSFFMVFGLPALTSLSGFLISEVIYYAIFMSTFYVGWALVQVSFAALVADASKVEHDGLMMNR
jgi:Na+/melibiose symporter-like transporter